MCQVLIPITLLKFALRVTSNDLLVFYKNNREKILIRFEYKYSFLAITVPKKCEKIKLSHIRLSRAEANLYFSHNSGLSRPIFFNGVESYSLRNAHKHFLSISHMFWDILKKTLLFCPLFMSYLRPLFIDSDEFFLKLAESNSLN